MRKRLFKYLRRFLYVVLALGLLGLIAFTWICYWPLEGDVENLEDLVPPQVEFVARFDYDELANGEWIQTNILGDPAIHPEIALQRDLRLPEREAQVADIEAQINSQIPFGIIDFRIADDVLSGEVVIAGVICEGQRPPDPPAWQELLILKRLPWKSRAGLAAALGHEWIRDMAVHPSRARFKDEGHGIFKVTDPTKEVRSVRERSGCGRGYVMPPDNEWYVFQTKDVVALSNSKGLIQEVEQRSRRSQDALEADDGLFLPEAEPGRIVAAGDLEPLQTYLYEVVADTGRPAGMIQRYVNTRALRRIRGFIDLENPEVLRGQAQLDVRTGGLSPEAQETYKLPRVDMREGLTGFVPAEDTFMVATLSIKPGTFLATVSKDYVTDEERQRIDNLVQERGKYKDLTEFLDDLASRLGDVSYIALGRISETFDQAEFPTWYADEADPEPAFAFMTRIREGTNLDEVNAFLRDAVPTLGFTDEFIEKEHEGIPYTRIQLEVEMRDFVLLTPCWLLSQDHFVFCSNEDYFKKIIETIADPSKSLARDNNFRVTMGRVREKGHVGLFVDLDKLFRVPETTDPGDMPRGLMWDLRNRWVTANYDEREEAIRYRQELEDEFRVRKGRRPNDQERLAIEDKVYIHAELHRENYSSFVGEYHEFLQGFARLRSFGVVIAAGGGELELDAALMVKPVDDDEGPLEDLGDDDER